MRGAANTFMQPGISTAAVAMAHDINVNLLPCLACDAEMKRATEVASKPPFMK